MLANEFLRRARTRSSQHAPERPDAQDQHPVLSRRGSILRALSYCTVSISSEHRARDRTRPAGGRSTAAGHTRFDIYNYIVSESQRHQGRAAARGRHVRPRDAGAAHMLLPTLPGMRACTPAPRTTPEPPLSAIRHPARAQSGCQVRHNFQADNNTSPELIFVAAQDGAKTQTWGGMTFLIHRGLRRPACPRPPTASTIAGGVPPEQQAYRRSARDGRAAFFWTTVRQIR